MIVIINSVFRLLAAVPHKRPVGGLHDEQLIADPVRPG
jgi:hypothetical protein